MAQTARRAHAAAARARPARPSRRPASPQRSVAAMRNAAAAARAGASCGRARPRPTGSPGPGQARSASRELFPMPPVSPLLTEIPQIGRRLVPRNRHQVAIDGQPVGLAVDDDVALVLTIVFGIRGHFFTLVLPRYGPG